MLRKPGALIALLTVAGAVLAGCGSSSPNRPAATQTAPARQTPQLSNPDVGGTQQQSSHPAAALGQLPVGGSHATGGKAKPHITTSKVVKARQTPGTTRDDENSTGAKPLNPCKLVNLSEAQTITEGAITKLSEAPLGPTCIYSGHGTAPGITLAVESADFNQATRHMSVRKHIVIGGHRSVCGRLGTEMLFVPLGRYQLLNVTAPCRIARAFAAVAVGRLSA